LVVNSAVFGDTVTRRFTLTRRWLGRTSVETAFDTDAAGMAEMLPGAAAAAAADQAHVVEPTIVKDLAGYLASAQLTFTPEGVPENPKKFDPTKALVMREANLRRHGLLEGPAPRGGAEGELKVVAASDMDAYLCRQHWIDPNCLPMRSEVGTPLTVYVSREDDTSVSDDMTKAGFLKVELKFLRNNLSLPKRLADPTAIDEDADEDEDDVEMSDRLAPLLLLLAPVVPDLPRASTESMALYTVREYEEFVVWNGKTYSPYWMYTKEARAADPNWHSGVDAKKNQGNYSERCKAFVGVCLSPMLPESNGAGATALKALALELTKEERSALSKPELAGFWSKKALALYNEKIAAIACLP
jgi:hypothetical protein